MGCRRHNRSVRRCEPITRWRGTYDAQAVAALAAPTARTAWVARWLGNLEVADGLAIGMSHCGRATPTAECVPGRRGQIELAQPAGGGRRRTARRRGQGLIILRAIPPSGDRLLPDELHITQAMPIDGDEQGGRNDSAKLYCILLRRAAELVTPARVCRRRDFDLALRCGTEPACAGALGSADNVTRLGAPGGLFSSSVRRLMASFASSP